MGTIARPRFNQSSAQHAQTALIGLESALTSAIASAELAGLQYQPFVTRLLVLKRDVIRLRAGASEGFGV